MPMDIRAKDVVRTAWIWPLINIYLPGQFQQKIWPVLFEELLLLR